MIPRSTHKKIEQSLKRIKKAWLEDIAESPHLSPYDCSGSIVDSITHHLLTDYVCGRRDTGPLIKETVDYFKKKKVLFDYSLGGLVFELPENATVETRDEVISRIKRTFG